MSTDHNYSDKLKLIAALKNAALFKFDLYDIATEHTIQKLDTDLRRDEKALKELSKYVPDVNEDNYSGITNEEWKLIDEYSGLYSEVVFRKEHLLSLFEMKVVYLFKSLEVIMKRMIHLAYPKARTKDFYHWDNMKTFVKSNEIDISVLDGYNECIEVRRVNNAIKHNGIINDDIKSLKEFINQVEFNYINLDLFYKRVKPKVECFTKALRNSIEKNLYDFPDERLAALANNFHERMDKSTFENFISILKRRLAYPSGELDDMIDDLPF